MEGFDLADLLKNFLVAPIPFFIHCGEAVPEEADLALHVLDDDVDVANFCFQPLEALGVFLSEGLKLLRGLRSQLLNLLGGFLKALIEIRDEILIHEPLSFELAELYHGNGEDGEGGQGSPYKIWRRCASRSSLSSCTITMPSSPSGRAPRASLFEMRTAARRSNDTSPAIPD